MSTVAPVTEVPHVISGRLLRGAEVEHRTHDGQARFATPPLDLAEVVQPRSQPGPAFDLPIAEVVDFLEETGKRLGPGNPYLEEASVRLEPLSDLPRSVLEACYATLGEPFSREVVEMMLGEDVGVEALDGWRAVPKYDGRASYVRAFPPRLVHVLAGNAPGVAAESIVTSALTKGVHLLKLPSNDPFTVTAILRTMADIDPEHPVVRSISAVYWRGGDTEVESAIYRPQFFDKLVAWGGEAAIRHVMRYIGPGFQLVTFDPKSSISLIGREAFASDEALREAAVAAAIDTSVFEQDACVSSRFHYVEGSTQEVDRYCEVLASELGVERTLSSSGSRGTPAEIRDEVEVLRLLEPAFRIWGDYSGSGLVVRSEDPVGFHPDGRTVNVVPVESLAEALRFANVSTQTVGIYPHSRRIELRDKLAAAGVQRITRLGRAVDVPPGMPHDGMYVLNRLVRWVADEG